MNDHQLRAAVENFLFREARLLDERRFEEWRDLFAEDGIYWVPVRPEQTEALHEVSIFYDDPTALAARIRRLRHPRAHAELPPTRAVRAVTNIEIEAGADAANVRSVLTMSEFREQSVTVYMARVQWTLRRAGDDFRIALKRVDLVNADGIHHVMTVPF